MSFASVFLTLGFDDELALRVEVYGNEENPELMLWLSLWHFSEVMLCLLLSVALGNDWSPSRSKHWPTPAPTWPEAPMRRQTWPTNPIPWQRKPTTDVPEPIIPSDNGNNGLSPGSIVAICFGVFMGIGVLGFAYVLWNRRKAKRMDLSEIHLLDEAE